MTELGRMLEMYKRRGFETLSEQERHVLNELMLSAVVEVQERTREILEGLRILDPLAERVKRIEEWKKEVEEPLGDVLDDRKAWKEDVRTTRRALVEKAILALLAAAIVALGAYLGIREAAGRSSSVDVPPALLSRVDEREDVEEEGASVGDEQPRVRRPARILPALPLRHGDSPPRMLTDQLVPAMHRQEGEAGIPTFEGALFQHRERPEPRAVVPEAGGIGGPPRLVVPGGVVYDRIQHPHAIGARLRPGGRVSEGVVGEGEAIEERPGEAIRPHVLPFGERLSVGVERPLHHPHPLTVGRIPEREHLRVRGLHLT